MRIAYPCSYQCLNIQMGIKAQTMEADQYIQVEVHNGGLNGKLNTSNDLKNWYIGTMAFDMECNITTNDALLNLKVYTTLWTQCQRVRISEVQ